MSAVSAEESFPALAAELRRALALQRQGRTSEAQAAYHRVLVRDPGIADAVHMLGVTHLQIGNFGEALRQLRRAAELFEWRLPAVRHNLGLAIAALLAGEGRANAARLWQAYDRRLDELRTPSLDVAPRISVVLPSFNHARYVESALESVYLQTYRAIELIVVDDGSSDDSVERIRKLLRRSPFPVRFCARRNRGASETINEAVAHSAGEFVNVLNSDDRFAPSRLSTMVDAVARCGALWGFSRVALVDAEGATLAADASTRTAELSYLADDIGARDTAGMAFLAANPAISSGSLFFARSLFDRLGGFRNLRYNHDWDFCLRASVIAEPVIVASTQYEYRLHDCNTILESMAAAKKEADAMFVEFYHSALQMRSGQNPFAPVPAVWGARFFVQVLSCGHAALLPSSVLCDLADRAAALDNEARA